LRAETEEDGRIALIQSDIWIGFPRAEQVLDRLQCLIEMPRQTRMPGLLVHGASGIGKTMIARNLSRRYAPEYDPESGITRTPLLLLQAPPAPDERRLYMHILAAVGAPFSGISATNWRRHWSASGSAKRSMPFVAMSSWPGDWMNTTCRTGATTPSSRT
jgi:hypothetical protein